MSFWGGDNIGLLWLFYLSMEGGLGVSDRGSMGDALKVWARH